MIIVGWCAIALLFVCFSITISGFCLYLLCLGGCLYLVCWFVLFVIGVGCMNLLRWFWWCLLVNLRFGGLLGVEQVAWSVGWLLVLFWLVVEGYWMLVCWLLVILFVCDFVGCLLYWCFGGLLFMFVDCIVWVYLFIVLVLWLWYGCVVILCLLLVKEWVVWFWFVCLLGLLDLVFCFCLVTANSVGVICFL